MKLTDEDRAALADETKDYLETPWRDINSALDAAYVAGKLDGAEAMRERAAKVCEPIVEREWKSGDVDHNEIPWSLVCVNAIRALEVDDE